MLSYCFKCRQNTQSKNTNVAKTKKGRIKNLLKSKKLQDYYINWRKLKFRF